MSNFFEKYMNDEVTVDDLDDFLEEWHNSASNLEIDEYLGLTEEQYFAWCQDPEKLKQMLDKIKSTRKVASRNKAVADEIRKIASSIDGKGPNLKGD